MTKEIKSDDFDSNNSSKNSSIDDELKIDINNSVTKIFNRLLDKDKEISKLKDELSHKDMDIDHFKRRSQKREAELSIFKEKIVGLEEEKIQIELNNKNKIDKYIRQIAELENQLNGCNGNNPKISELNSRIKKIKGELDTRNIEIKNLENKLKILETKENPKFLNPILAIDVGDLNFVVVAYDGLKKTLIPSKEGTNLYGKTFLCTTSFLSKLGTYERIEVGNNQVYAKDICKDMFSKIKEDSEDFLAKPISDVVISVPINFSFIQRKEIEEAAKDAGLNVLYIINQSNAAKTYYDDMYYDNILFFDLSAETLDIFIMSRIGKSFELVSFESANVGGNDITNVIFDYFIQKFKDSEGINLLDDNYAVSQLKKKAEEAKVKLSSLMEIRTIVPDIALDSNNNPVNFDMLLNRNILESLIKDIVKKFKIPLTKVLNDGIFSKENIDLVILLGGSSNIPFVVEFMEEFMGKSIENKINPLEIAAMGAIDEYINNLG